jgi:hypothetical protein
MKHLHGSSIFAALLLTSLCASTAHAGAPLKGIDVKLGKNPGGGCAARTSASSDSEYVGVATSLLFTGVEGNPTADRLGTLDYASIGQFVADEGDRKDKGQVATTWNLFTNTKRIRKLFLEDRTASPALYTWVQNSIAAHNKGGTVVGNININGGRVPEVSIILADDQGNPREQLVLTNVMLTDVILPDLELTSAPTLQIGIAPETLEVVEIKQVPAIEEKGWLPALFNLEVDGLNNSCGTPTDAPASAASFSLPAVRNP